MAQKGLGGFLKKVVKAIENTPTVKDTVNAEKYVGKKVGQGAKYAYKEFTLPTHGKLGLKDFDPGPIGLDPRIAKGVKTAAKTLWSGSSPKTKTAPDPWTSKSADVKMPHIQNVKAMQQILRNHGYNIAVDGIVGPKTESALENFHSSGGNATKWNAANAPTTTTKNTTDASTNGSNDNSVAKPSSSTGTSGTSNSTNDTSVLSQLMNAMTSGEKTINPSQYTVNPTQYATAEADQQYNPSISTAQQDITQANKQAAVDQTDLTKWFGDAASITSAGAKQAQQMEQTDQANQAKASSAILAAFGGNASGAGASLANTAQNGANALAAEDSGTDAFNSMLKGLVSTEGADAKAQQSNTDQTNIADLKNSLSQLIAQKAAAVTANTADAKNQNLSNLVSITNANNTTDANNLNSFITQMELPSTLEASGLKNDLTTAEINKDNAGMKSTIQEMKERGMIDTATYNHLIAETAKDLKSSTKPLESSFAKATTSDIINARNYLASVISKESPKTPQAAAALMKTYSPWSVSTPGVFSKVILPALAQGNVTGVTAPMFGITNG